jgi:LacI family transcriptional regulator
MMRHVALFIESSTSYGRGLLRGIAKYNRERAEWSTYFQPQGLGAPLPVWLKSWKGNGILARVDGPETVRMLAKTGLPVVHLRNAQGNLQYPCVCLDNDMVARLAADHLLQRGLRHFAFCGNARGLHQMLDKRGDEFRRLIQKAGFDCHVVPAVGPKPVPWEKQQERLADWIDTLPKPVGIMASNDERGLMVLDACRRRKHRAPEEVAVIGVDNDEYLCDLSVPPLTSIDVNAEQVGAAAAELLDSLMAGHAPPPAPIIIPPRGIIARRSTDMLASEDPAVNCALAFIQENAGRGIQVPDVAAHVKMSRASLEPRIKRILGRTIHQEIQRVQLEQVKSRLVHGSIPLKQVAREAGFSCVQYMNRVFRASTGETPARFRARRKDIRMEVGAATAN